MALLENVTEAMILDDYQVAIKYDNGDIEIKKIYHYNLEAGTVLCDDLETEVFVG